LPSHEAGPSLGGEVIILVLVNLDALAFYPCESLDNVGEACGAIEDNVLDVSVVEGHAERGERSLGAEDAVRGEGQRC
jgi:hypothetical protein